MANSIKVKVLDKKTLELSENASEGDYIELDKIESLDTGYISSLIEKEKETLLRKRVEEEVKKKEQELNSQKEAALAKQKVELLEENNKKIEEFKENLANLKLNYEKQISESEKKHKDEINKLANENEKIKANFDSSVANKEKELENKFLKVKNEIDRSYLEEKEKFKSQIVELELEKKNLIDTKEKDIQIEIDKITSKFNEEKDKLKRDYDEKIAKLTRDKSVLNSKNIGEDLEVWCDREIRQYMQNGFLNCSWEKDNTVIKNEGENKGSKADFIFKIYADEEKTNANFLTSVCLEMKDENPESTNKKTNKDYYAQLDNNRKKKGTKYALLVSDLERDKSNDLPIYKVIEYKDMYVVRPEYMMTFLNMLVSLNTTFAKLTLIKSREDEKFKSLDEFSKEFDALKKTYLDSQLEKLEKDINSLEKSNETIFNASKNISDTIAKIRNGYINQIQEKLNKFQVKVNREFNKTFKE